MGRGVTGSPVELETVIYEQGDDGVAVVTLNRPERQNAFDTTMQRELQELWKAMRGNDDVRAVVLTAAGERSFCTGIDRDEVPTTEGDYKFSPYTYEDPGLFIGPRSQDFWKPVIGAVNGMACGGAFYLLGECDFLIAAEHATFFDPHVTYGMPAVFEPALLVPRMPFGEVMRLALMGVHERITAAKAEAIGLVSQVVPGEDLPSTARTVAATLASQPPAAVQATLRTIWAVRDVGAKRMQDLGNTFLNLATTQESLQTSQEIFTARKPAPPTYR